MQSKILSRRTLIAAFIGVALSAVLFHHLIPRNSVSSVKQQLAQSSLPVRLKIPSIKVDAAIEQVGLTPAGAMDTTKGPNNVAWYRLGPHPGESGSAVIAGHYGWKAGVPAVFDNLYKLRIGDKLYVEDERGATTTFVVSGTRRYDQEADASGVFNSQDGKPHLNLITCEGVWDRVSGSYSKRLVVFTDKVPPE